MIIGLTGPRYAGKTEVAGIFKNSGFDSLSLGDEVRLERDARGLPKDYDLHKLAVDLRGEFGAHYWSVRVAGRINRDVERKYVIDGMRTLGDLEVFQGFPDFILVGVIAPIETRWKRCKVNQRGRSDDIPDYEDFVRRCERDESTEHGGLQSSALFEKRCYTIDNNSSIEELDLRVAYLLANLRGRA